MSEFGAKLSRLVVIYVFQNEAQAFSAVTLIPLISQQNNV
jgi:hypothetical protein